MCEAEESRNRYGCIRSIDEIHLVQILQWLAFDVAGPMANKRKTKELMTNEYDGGYH